MACPVLLLTHSQDFYVPDLVAQALADRGVASRRVDTDRFPTGLGLEVEPSGGGVRTVLSDGAERLELEAVPAFWARRLLPGWVPDGPADVLEARANSRRLFLDALALLPRERFVNPIQSAERAENKLLQLRAAAEAGFETPRTLVTNHPEALRRFHAGLGRDRMITKLLEPVVQSMSGHPDFVYTSEVRPEHLAHADRIRVWPRIFQALVIKRCELRVIVVGERVLAGSIDTRESPTGALDWRRTSPAEGVRWIRAELPDEVAERAVRVTRSLGLVYAALDVIVDEEGRHVFLELNPAGEWGWLQRDLGLPIAEAIADALVDRSAP